MLQYDFMRKALIAGFFISIIIPLIGTIVVNRKTSTIGDALSHTTLGGIFFGLIIGVNPILGGVLMSILAAFSIESLRNKFPKNGDMATAIVTSLGIGLASILSDYVPGSQNFESFLFGSVIAINNVDILIILLTTIVVVFIYYYLYYGLLYISVDKLGARLAGVKNNFIDYMFTFMLAITIAISARIVGVLIVSSLMILPVATAMLIGKNYKMTVLFSILFGVLYFISGLVAAYHLKLKPGGSIIVVAVIGLVLTMAIKSIYHKFMLKT
ncbi:MAG: metal ABC transporter permease [Tissierellia bacterium]|nr:metal ABC transporter permease [Tissierellia bacterium]